MLTSTAKIAFRTSLKTVARTRDFAYEKRVFEVLCCRRVEFGGLLSFFEKVRFWRIIWCRQFMVSVSILLNDIWFLISVVVCVLLKLV